MTIEGDEMTICGTCESCTGEPAAKCAHGHYRHRNCVRCARDAIDTALAELSEANPEQAIAVLEEALSVRH